MADTAFAVFTLGDTSFSIDQRLLLIKDTDIIELILEDYPYLLPIGVFLSFIVLVVLYAYIKETIEQVVSKKRKSQFHRFDQHTLSFSRLSSDQKIHLKSLQSYVDTLGLTIIKAKSNHNKGKLLDSTFQMVVAEYKYKDSDRSKTPHGIYEISFYDQSISAEPIIHIVETQA